MKFLIASLEDSESGADDYLELKIKNFKSGTQAVDYVKKQYGKKTKLYKLDEIKINFRKGSTYAPVSQL